jgi:hypothetical protein
MPVSWIEHNGKRVLYGDYRNLKTSDEMLANLELEAKVTREAEGQVLCLDDFRDAAVTGPFMDRAKALGKQVFAAKVARNAVLGITGVRKVLLNAYNAVAANSLRAFDNEGAAKDFLVQ